MLIALNKPYGVLCQFTDAEGRRTLADFVTQKDVYPAGRLDHDSEGLLLLTDDGRLAHRLTDPKHKQPKTYLVQVDGQVTDDAVAALRRGVMLNDGPTLPAGVEHAAEPAWLWPRDPPVRFRKADPHQLVAHHLARRAQPPGAAHDGGGGFSNAAPDPRANWPTRTGWLAPRKNARHPPVGAHPVREKPTQRRRRYRAQGALLQKRIRPARRTPLPLPCCWPP